MSWRRSITLLCDGCGDSGGSGDLGDQTVAEARLYARQEGWVVARPGGLDLCPDCRLVVVDSASDPVSAQALHNLATAAIDAEPSDG